MEGSLRKFRNAINTYKKKFAEHLITESIVPALEGRFQITLRVFVDKSTYDTMEDAKFSTPYYFEKDVDKVPESLRNVLVKWWGTQNAFKVTPEDGKINKLTVIP